MVCLPKRSCADEEAAEGGSARHLWVKVPLASSQAGGSTSPGSSVSPGSSAQPSAQLSCFISPELHRMELDTSGQRCWPIMMWSPFCALQTDSAEGPAKLSSRQWRRVALTRMPVRLPGCAEARLRERLGEGATGVITLANQGDAIQAAMAAAAAR